MRVDYQFYAERRKLPPCATQILMGKVAFIIGSNGKTVVNGALPVPDGFWGPTSKDGSQ